MSNGNEPEVATNFRLPVVRHFIACERIDAAASGAKKEYSLHNIIHAIQPLPGAGYPRINPSLSLFAQLTNGRGSHSFQIQKVLLDDESTYTCPPVILDLGADPLVVHEYPFRLKNVRFQREGLYEFRLLCDSQVIARETILLREMP